MTSYESDWQKLNIDDGSEVLVWFWSLHLSAACHPETTRVVTPGLVPEQVQSEGELPVRLPEHLNDLVVRPVRWWIIHFVGQQTGNVLMRRNTPECFNRRRDRTRCLDRDLRTSAACVRNRTYRTWTRSFMCWRLKEENNTDCQSVWQMKSRFCSDGMNEAPPPTPRPGSLWRLCLCLCWFWLDSTGPPQQHSSLCKDV